MDVSKGGALLQMPMKVPIRQGQSLEINFPRLEPLAKEKGSSARIKQARVVRVDRSEILASAMIKVGLVFCGAEAVADAAGA